MKFFLVAVVLVAALCGCGADASSTPTSTPSTAATPSGGASLVDDYTTVTPTPEPTPAGIDTAAAADILFLALVRAKAPNLALAADDKVVALGKAICADYKSGLSTQAIGAQMVANGRGDTLASDLETAVAQAGYIIGVSTNSYCPEYDGR